MEKSRVYVFTITSPIILPDFSQGPRVEYAIYREALTPEGVLFVEGYLEMFSRVAISSVLKLPGLESAVVGNSCGTQLMFLEYLNSTSELTRPGTVYTIFGTPRPCKKDIKNIPLPLPSTPYLEEPQLLVSISNWSLHPCPSCLKKNATLFLDNGDNCQGCKGFLHNHFQCNNCSQYFYAETVTSQTILCDLFGNIINL